MQVTAWSPWRCSTNRLGRVIEGMHPVVEGRGAPYILAEGCHVSRDRSVHDTAREGRVISPLDQEAGLVIRVVIPGQGDSSRLLILHAGTRCQVGWAGDGRWWLRHVLIGTERQRRPAATRREFVEAPGWSNPRYLPPR